MSNSPIFRNCDEIAPSDFAEHPIWVSCHLVDYEETWYDDVDEEAFRAHVAALPIDRSMVAYISAKFITSNGTELSGYIENWGESNDRNTVLDFSPTIFGVDGYRIDLWHGATYQFGTERMEKCMSEFRKLAGGALNDHFPINCSIDSSIFGRELKLTFEGFGSYVAEGVISICDN